MNYRIEIDRHTGEGWTTAGLGIDDDACTFETYQQAQVAINELESYYERFEGDSFRIVEVEEA